MAADPANSQSTLNPVEIDSSPAATTPEEPTPRWVLADLLSERSVSDLTEFVRWHAMEGPRRDRLIAVAAALTTSLTTARAETREIVEGNAQAGVAFNRRLNDLLDLYDAPADADPFVRIVALGEAAATAQAERDALRKEWWANHGFAFHGTSAVLYGDDGELQCSACGIDFKRDDIEDIRLRIEAIAKARMLAAPSPTGGPQHG
jgi:hypothetical protein